MLLNDVPIPWVKSIKYLGIVLVAGISLHVDCGYVKRKILCIVQLYYCQV